MVSTFSSTSTSVWVLNATPSVACTNGTCSVVYTYGSDLEKNSSRFNAPGDFFTYIVFVATVILVSGLLLLASLLNWLGFEFFVTSYYTSYYLPAQSISLAEAVPGNEEDCPCTSCNPSFAISIYKGCYAV